jgi:AcrR family transcriptional regulator
MPNLGRELRAGVTSVYWYFRSKDDLLAALVEKVTKDMYLRLPPIGDGPWDAELIEYFVAWRELLERTPVYREVFAYRVKTLFLRSRMAPAMLGRLEEGLDLFVRAGMTPDEALRAFNTLTSFTVAFVLVEHGMQMEDVTAEMLDEINQTVQGRRAQLPELSQVSDINSPLSDEQYRLGLRMLIAGIKRTHRSLGATTARRSARAAAG